MTKANRLTKRIFDSVDEAVDWLIAPERRVLTKELEIELQQKEQVTTLTGGV
jgi:hypothetical protein